jgi:hypothetical protein
MAENEISDRGKYLDSKYQKIKELLDKLPHIQSTPESQYIAEVKFRSLIRSVKRMDLGNLSTAKKMLRSLNEFKRQTIFTVLDLNPPRLVEKLFPSSIVLEYKDNKEIAIFEKRKQQQNLSL